MGVSDVAVLHAVGFLHLVSQFMGQHRGVGVSFPLSITEPTPAVFVYIMGWIVLALSVVVGAIYYFNG
jgi:hypothetical protein